MSPESGQHAYCRVGHAAFGKAQRCRLADSVVAVNAEWVVVAEPVATRASRLADLFKSAGFGVRIAHNGDEIGPLLERVPPPTLLVLQLNIPVVEGMKVLDDLRRSERKSPVLALRSAPKLLDA